MRRHVISMTCALAVAFAAAASGARPVGAATNLVANGSFETPKVPDGTLYRDFGTGQHVAAWRVTVGAVFVSVAEPPWETPPDGAQVMNLRRSSGSGDGEICQTVDGLVRGGAYRLRLLAATVLGESTIDVSFAGKAVGRVALKKSPIPAVFHAHAWTVTAAAGSEALCLHGTGPTDGTYPLVDAVRLERVSG